MDGAFAPQPIDDSAIRAAESVRQGVEHELGHPVSVYEVLEAHSQVVAGTNYKLKVRVSDTECVHLKVYVPLPHLRMLPRLDNFQAGHTVTSPLD